MIDWLARAKAHFAEPRGVDVDETDETRVSSVLSVDPGPDPGVDDPLSSVLSVAPTPFGEISRPPTGTAMTPEQVDECHFGGWSDAEIATFIAREAHFKRLGRIDAEHLAERLTLRDRQADDHRMCLECCELGPSGHCGSAHPGPLPNADRTLEPAPAILTRCVAFRRLQATT